MISDATGSLSIINSFKREISMAASRALDHPMVEREIRSEILDIYREVLAVIADHEIKKIKRRAA